MKVGFLTAGCMIPGHPNLRTDYWEHEREFPPLRVACKSRGIELREVIWDDPALIPTEFDAFVIGTTWDYTDKPDVYLQTLERISVQRSLLNPLDTVRWNSHKTYLRDLAERCVDVVPTLWRQSADEATITRAFDELGADEIVVKPVIGASAWRQARLRRGEPIPEPSLLPPAHTMIQPFLPAVVDEGEFSFIYFDRTFSHCAQKLPAAGDYRVQAMYGGHERVYHPSAEELSLAQRVVDAVSGPLLYARVDMLRVPSGQLALMELELIEPYYYPEQGPGFASLFAEALCRLLR